MTTATGRRHRRAATGGAAAPTGAVPPATSTTGRTGMMQGDTPAKKPATTPITISSATSRCSLCQMRCSRAATWGS